MTSDVSLVAAVILLIAVAALGGSRIVLGERHAGDGVRVAGPRPARLQLIDRGLVATSLLLVIAFAVYLAAGVG